MLVPLHSDQHVGDHRKKKEIKIPDLVLCPLKQWFSYKMHPSFGVKFWAKGLHRTRVDTVVRVSC